MPQSTSAQVGPRHARRGQVAILFALSLVVFIGALSLGIDLSRLRVEAENAQRAANAAVLAGVVFLPDFPDNAEHRARQEAVKDGFIDGHNGVSVVPQPDATNPNRLKVTVTEPMSLFFGGVFGLGPKTISRSATAEYTLPLEMGSPDNVLGYSPFPTQLVSTGGTEGYYLEVKGPNDLEENGDAYSPYYESYNQNTGTGLTYHAHPFNPLSSGTYEYSNPCNDPNPPGCTVSGATNNLTHNAQVQLTTNPDRAALAKLTGNTNVGYDYVIENPTNSTLVVKLFDPYDEANYNNDIVNNVCNVAANGVLCSTAPKNKSIPGGSFGNENIDAKDSTDFGDHVTTTEFSIAGPGLTASDPSMPPIGAPTSGDPTCASANCALVNNGSAFDAGDDPAYIACHHLPNTNSPPNHPSQRAVCYKTARSYSFQFLNYAILHGRGFYRIHVNVVVNNEPSTPDTNTYGTHGNMFGIGVCSGTGPLGTAADPSAGGFALHDPTTGGFAWDPSTCESPNASTACTNPSTAPPGQCVHIFGLGRMCIYNNLANGNSLIPLGYVPAGYEGRTLHVDLYDVGDSNSGSIEALTPAGDENYYGNSPGTRTNQTFPVALPFYYYAAPTDPNSGYVSSFSQTNQSPLQPAGTTLAVSSSSHLYNGSWLHMSIPLTDSTYGTKYANMVAKFGGYWKMLYQVAGGNDTTTWSISVDGSPVHLVNE